MDRPGDNHGTRPAIRNGPRSGDAFGALLMECWEHGAEPGRVLELIERDDGYLAGDDAARYFDRPDTWGPLNTWACEKAQGRVLDIGSGAGRHALHLQAAGLEVVALDISPLAAEVCRRRGVQRVVTGTVSDLGGQDAGCFDSFLMLGNNLGLLGDAENAPRILEALSAQAAPDAVIIGQGMDPYQTENPLHLAYHEWNRTRGRMPGQIRMRVRHEDLATPWFDYLFTSVEELEALLNGSDWRLEHCERDGASYVALLRHSV